jgi:hypothetical protein
MNILEMHREDRYVPSKPPVRPGSEDALACPSLVNGVRVPYKPPSQGCVGILKDRTSHSGVYQENLGSK